MADEKQTEREEIQRILIAIVADELSVDEKTVSPASRFAEDLGADSLDNVELVMRCEEEFEIEIPDEDAEKVTTVGEAVTLIEKLRKYDP